MPKLLTLLFLLLPAFLWALDGSVRGKVTDRATGSNITGAQIWVMVSGTNQIRAQAITDGEGNFVIENLSPATYDVECIAAGHISQKIVGLQIGNNSIRLAYFKMNSNKNLMLTGGKKNLYLDSVELIYTQASLQARQNAEVKAATATTQTLLDQPATGYLISNDDIILRGYVTLLDLLRDVPEVEINDNASTDFQNVISSRGVMGIGRWYIMQDGIKINSFTGSDVALCQNMPIRHAERVEIVMGAASAVYGADAFSGVINIISRDPEKVQGAELMSSYGSFNESNNSLVIAAAKKELSVMYSGSFFNSQSPNYAQLYPEDYRFYNDSFQNGLGYVRTSPINSSVRPFSEPVQPFAMPSQAVSSLLQMRYKSLSFGVGSYNESHSSSTSTRPEFNPPTASNRYSSSVNIAYISHELLRKRWQLESVIQVNQNFVYPYSSYNNTFSAYERVYKYGYERAGFWKETFNYQINKKQQFTAGISFMGSNSLARTANLPQQYDTGLIPSEQPIMYHTGTDTVDYQGNFLGVPIAYYQENRLQEGIFAQYQLNIKEKFYLIAGVRGDMLTILHPEDNAIHHYPQINERLGLVYKPNKNIRLKLFLGTSILTPSPNKTLSYFGSFRLVKDSLNQITGVAPNLWKLPTSEELQLINGGAEEPVPERVRSAEWSFTYTKNDLLITCNGFYNYLTNIIATETFYNVQFFDSLPPVPVAQIVTSEGQGMAYGAAARIDYCIRLSEKSNIRLNASYVWTDGRLIDEDDDDRVVRLPFTAAHTAKLGLGFQYDKFSIHLKGLFRSSSVNEGYETADGDFIQKGNPSFFVMSAFANYQLASLDKDRFLIDIFVRARNLLNTRYYNTSMLNSAAFDAVPQEPFGIFGGVSLRFNR